MAAAKRKKALTAQQIRKLPWPKELLADEPLSSDEGFEVGRLVVEKVWGGDFDRARKRKAWSLRRLCEVLGVASAASMTRYVQVYEVAQQLKLKRPLHGVRVSTLFSVAGLPPVIRQKVARKAIAEGWTKHRVQEEVRRHLPKRSWGGRPSRPAFIKALNACKKSPLLGEINAASSLESADIRQALSQIDSLTKDLGRLKAHLQKASKKDGAAARSKKAKKSRRAKK